MNTANVSRSRRPYSERQRSLRHLCRPFQESQRELCERPEDKMIKFLPSATHTRNTRGNTARSLYRLHSSCLFVCLFGFVCGSRLSLPRFSRAKKVEERRRVKGNISTSMGIISYYDTLEDQKQ